MTEFMGHGLFFSLRSHLPNISTVFLYLVNDFGMESLPLVWHVTFQTFFFFLTRQSCHPSLLSSRYAAHRDSSSPFLLFRGLRQM